MDNRIMGKLWAARLTIFTIAAVLAAGIVLAVPAQDAYAAEPNYDLYKKVLQDEYKRTIGARAGMCEYSVFDIDRDGTCELIVWSWYQGNEGASWVTTYTISGSKVHKIDELLSEASYRRFFSKGTTLFYSFDVGSYSNNHAGRVTKNGNAISYSISSTGLNTSSYIKSNNASELKRARYDDYSLLPGWKKDSVGWWYRYGNGSYPKSKWEMIGNSLYHFDSRGYMQTGWFADKGKWYYLKSSGAMATGWQQVNGKWYYLDKATGIMAANEWIEGWWLGKSGAWTYKYKGAWRKGSGSNSSKWWFGDTSGWYAKNGTQKIDGKAYNFDKAGWCTNPY